MGTSGSRRRWPTGVELSRYCRTALERLDWMEPEALTTPQRFSPSFLPDGDQFLVTETATASTWKTDRGGTPDRIRTCDPGIRNAVLYPAELRARAAPQGSVWGGSRPLPGGLLRYGESGEFVRCMGSQARNQGNDVSLLGEGVEFFRRQVLAGHPH